MLKFSVNLPSSSNKVAYKNYDYSLFISTYMSNINWLYGFSFVFNTKDYLNVFFAHLSVAVQCMFPSKENLNIFLTDFKKCTAKTSETYLTRKD